MSLRHLGFIELPPHRGEGGFDHAAVHEPTGHVYVAHTANDAVDVMDVERRTHLGSIAGLAAVAGALIPPASDLLFTSNRGANTVGIGRVGDLARLDTVAVGVKPNGLAHDGHRGRLLVAHVGDPVIPGSRTVSIVDVGARKVVADVAVPGRTRWTVYDPAADAFHVNVMDPPLIAVVAAADPVGVHRTVPIAHAGPHGLDLDAVRRRVFCACDAAVLVEVDADTGRLVAEAPVAGPPDVIFLDAALGRLYVAIGDPGVLEVFDTVPLRRRETIVTEPGAHTLSFDAARNVVCAFLPATHRAAVYHDRP
jgi:DNA-binding beta-propeller fold protein YncE